MPEGDTVWRAARRLHEALADETITGADLRWPGLSTADLRGMRTLEVVSRGKNLLHRLDAGLTLHSHLRMEGQWRVETTEGLANRTLANPSPACRGVHGAMDRAGRSARPPAPAGNRRRGPLGRAPRARRPRRRLGCRRGRRPSRRKHEHDRFGPAGPAQSRRRWHAVRQRDPIPRAAEPVAPRSKPGERTDKSGRRTGVSAPERKPAQRDSEHDRCAAPRDDDVRPWPFRPALSALRRQGPGQHARRPSSGPRLLLLPRLSRRPGSRRRWTHSGAARLIYPVTRPGVVSEATSVGVFVTFLLSTSCRQLDPADVPRTAVVEPVTEKMVAKCWQMFGPRADR